MGYKVKKRYVGTSLVRPDTWNPGSNTVAYYPLTSSSTVNDLSGNGYTLTNYNNTLFGTYNGVDCAKFSGSQYLYNDLFTTAFFGQIFTWNIRVTRGDNGEIVVGTFNDVGTKMSIGITMTATFIDFAIGTGSSWVDTIYNTNTVSNQWYNLVFTHNSSGNVKGYVNGELVATGTATVGEGASNFGIGVSRFGSGGTYYSNGTASNIIFENKVWTPEQIQGYYNNTKSNYGL